MSLSNGVVALIVAIIGGIALVISRADKIGRRLAIGSVVAGVIGIIGLVILDTRQVAQSAQENIIVTPTSIASTQQVQRSVTPSVLNTASVISEATVLTEPKQGLTPTVISLPPLPHTFPQDGITWAPDNGWWWICTGDLYLSSGGQLQALFADESAKTGQILVVESDSGITLSGSQGGYCTPASADEKVRTVEVEAKIARMKMPDNCVGGCTSVSVWQIGKNGKVTK